MTKELATKRNKTAQELESHILTIKTNVSQNTWDLAKTLKEVRDNEYFKELGYNDFPTWLSSPEIDLSYRWAMAFIDMHETFVLEHNIKPEELTATDYTKFYHLLPIVKKHPEDVAEWVSKAQTLRRVDLDREIRAQRLHDKSESIKKLAGEDKSAEPKVKMAVGDAVPMFAKFEDSSIDTIITYPPKVDTGWLAEAFKKLKDTGSMFLIGDYQTIYDLHASAVFCGFILVRDLVWYFKRSQKPVKIADLIDSHRIILWFRKGETYTNNLRDFTHDVMEYDAGSVSSHERDLPENVVADIMDMGTNIHDTIVDPFAAMGTVPVLAKRMGRKCIAVEADSYWANLASERVKNT